MNLRAALVVTLVLSFSMLMVGARASPVDDYLKVHDGTVAEISGACGKLNDLLNDLEKCEKKDVNLSDEKHDVKLSIEYLEEAKQVLYRDENNLIWLKYKYDSVKTKDRQERLLAEIMDGNNGLSECFDLINSIRRKLDNIENIADDAMEICDKFLKDKLDASEFKRDLDEVLSSDGGIVGNSGDVKDTSYTIEQSIDATVARVSELLEKWKQEDRSEAQLNSLESQIEGLRTWVIGGVILSLLAGVLFPMAPQVTKMAVLQALDLVTQLISMLLQVAQALQQLSPPLPSAAS